ncbi:MAG: YeeE/YedE family protein [Actinomycetota bacterium]|nr:YeeE/YedE family protein [Actinomycetota bacterium]
MLRMTVALSSGALFGLGLAVSGMANPQKVIGFLEVAGDWDPTLAFVMGGALLVAAPTFRMIFRYRHRPVLTENFELLTQKEIDTRLVGGSALFGVGWGLSGFCPGPAVVALIPALATGILPVFAFVAAMILGMVIYEWIF